MSNIDDRIVSMTFDNENFERRISATLDALDKLSESLKFVGAANGFNAVSQAADNVDFSTMSDSIQGISDRFSAMGAVAFTVIQDITNSILNMVKQTPQDLFNNILGGGKQRALNIESAKFLFEGLGADIDESMAEAKQAVLGTAFGLDEAAKAAAQLESSGVSLGDQLPQSLRAIAGVAAMTNSQFSEISDVFTQAAGQGKISGYTLERISYRGLNAAAALAKQLNLTEAQVRQMASDGKIDFATFAKAMDEAFGAHATEANKTYSGSLANLHAAMSRLGAEFQTPNLVQQRDIFNALTPVVDNLHEALKPLILTIVNLKGLVTTSIIGKLTNLNLDNLKNAIPLISVGVQNLFEGFHQLVSAGKDAFRDIFPKSSESILLRITAAFVKLTERIKMGDATVEKVKFVFDAIFSTLHVGIVIVQNIARVLGILFGAINKGSGGLGDYIVHLARLVQWYTSIFILSGKIETFFNGILIIVARVSKAFGNISGTVKDFRDTLSKMFSPGGGGGIDASSVEEPLGRVQQRLEQLKNLPDELSSAWQRFQDRFSGVFKVLDKVLDEIKNWFANLGKNIADAFGPGSFDQTVDLVNVGLLGGIAIILKKFLDGGLGNALSGGVAEAIRQAFNGLTDTLKAMQAQIKADTLLKIAAAVGVLTVSIVALSLINSAALTKALTAIAVGFGELIGTMKLLDKIDSSGVKTAALATAMNLIASSMGILSLAIAHLGKLSPGQVTRGLVGIAGAMTILVTAINLLGKSEGSGIAAGIGINLIATGLVVLAGAVKLFSLMDWGDIGKGLVAIAGGLVILGLAMAAIPPEGAIAALGIVPMAIGLTILAGAVKLFSLFGWAELAKGLVGIGGALVIIAAAMSAMPLTLPITAAGMVILSGALTALAGAVKIMGGIPLGEIAKGVGAFAAMLLVLAVGLNAMNSALPGVAALVVAALGLTVLSNVIEKLGKLSIDDLLKGLGAMAAVFVLLSVSALLMEPVIPMIAALGLAMGLVGGAFALFGAGVYLVAAGFEKLSESGVAGMHALIDMLKLAPEAIKTFLGYLLDSLLGAGKDLLNSLPELTRLFVAALKSLLEGIVTLAPLLGEALTAIVLAGLKYLEKTYPEAIKVGLELLLAVLRGIRDNIKEITTLAAEIIVHFIEGLTERTGDLVTAAFNFFEEVLIQVAKKLGESQFLFLDIAQAFFEGFINGLESKFGDVIDWFLGLGEKILDEIKSAFGINSPSTKMAEIGVDLILGLIQGLGQMFGAVMSFFINLPGQILGWLVDTDKLLIDKGIDLITGFLSGILQKALDVVSWFIGLPTLLIGLVPDLLGTLKDAGINLIKGFLKGIGDAFGDVINFFKDLPGKIVGAIPNPFDILKDVGGQIIDGLTGGIEGKVGSIGEAVKKVTGKVVDDTKLRMGINSPSRVMQRLGKFVVQGLVVGIENMAGAVRNATSKLADHVTSAFEDASPINGINDAFNEIVSHLSDLEDFNPTITPVLDLSGVQKSAGDISKVLKSASISPDVSIKNANVISSLDAANRAAGAQPSEPTLKEVNYTQNNYSPEPLSPIEIYRGTKSQLAMTKEELGIS